MKRIDFLLARRAPGAPAVVSTTETVGFAGVPYSNHRAQKARVFY